MNYFELEYKTVYLKADLISWWGKDEFEKRINGGDIYEINKGEYMRLD